MTQTRPKKVLITPSQSISASTVPVFTETVGTSVNDQADGSNQISTFTVTKQLGFVTFSTPQIIQTSGTFNTSLKFQTNIPSTYRPSSDVRVVVEGLNNSVITPCVVHISTDGGVTIRPATGAGASGAFGSTIMGFYAFQVTYRA
jgi:hypothetical protein